MGTNNSDNNTWKALMAMFLINRWDSAPVGNGMTRRERRRERWTEFKGIVILVIIVLVAYMLNK